MAYASGGGNLDANKCVPVTGDGAEGDSCIWGGAVAGTDDCNAQTMCWDIDANDVGTCALFCTGTPEEPVCPEGTWCVQANQGTIASCVESCDPLLPDCMAGTGCFDIDDGNGHFICVFTVEDPMPAGEPCGFINDCAPGHVCVAGKKFPTCGGSKCCASFCDLDLADTCQLPGTSCMPYFPDQAPAGDEDVGHCIAP